MTREEAIQILHSIKADNLNLEDAYTKRKYDALVMAIKVLEQEPCEDAVSRAEVIDELNRIGRNAFKEDTDYDNFFAFLDGLLPVTPTRKKGKWIKIGDRDFGYADIVICKCSECGNKEEFHGHYNGVSLELRSGYNYCPNCGADMREVEE